MAKKYSPSGYTVIDLTNYGVLSNMDEIELSKYDDGKVLKEIAHNVLVKKQLIKKPLLVRLNFDGCQYCAFANVHTSDDNLDMFIDIPSDELGYLSIDVFVDDEDETSIEDLSQIQFKEYHGE